MTQIPAEQQQQQQQPENKNGKINNSMDVLSD